MHKVNFFPIGNADCCLIELQNGKKIIIDYADKRDPDDEDDIRIDLPAKIRELVKDSVDILAITHADDDHFHKFSEFFYLEHASKYQSDERVKIKELWIPASIIIEKGLEDEAKILSSEAKYRFKKGTGIRVFSSPDYLSEWAEEQDIDLSQKQEILIHAGNLVPSLNREADKVEFFVHAPFSETIDGNQIDRNNEGLVLQATFLCEGQETKLFLGADAEWDAWVDIVNITKYYKRESRLEWDIFKIAHHSSYTSLSNEKGKEITTPTEEIELLFSKACPGAYLISSSNPIPENDEDLPPHRQAANYYKKIAEGISGEYRVTMEYPSREHPDILTIIIDKNKGTLQKRNVMPGIIATSRQAPKAGSK